MAYVQTFDKLHLSSLDQQRHEQTCGYWYVATSNHGPHTAFRTKAATLRWLERFGLSIDDELPDPGVSSFRRVNGAYRRIGHMDVDAFNALAGETALCLDNAHYTKGVVTIDEDGLRTLHHLNCNLPRDLFDHSTSRAAEDRGE